MREILFRGKRIDNGEWVEGNLVVCKNRCFIYVLIVNELVHLDVIPDTVGQFTGQTDKNGKKIFEGDIIKEYGEFIDCADFKCGCFIIKGKRVDKEFAYQDFSQIEVISNIHDSMEETK